MTIEELKDKVIGEIPHRWEHARTRAENHLDKLLEQVAKEQREICAELYFYNQLENDSPTNPNEGTYNGLKNAPSPLDETTR